MEELRKLKIQCNSLLKSSLHPDVELLNKIVNVECDLAIKYPSFDFIQLLCNNGQTDIALKQLSACLDVLCNYGLKLLTSTALCSNSFQQMPFSDQGSMKKIDCVQGAQALLHTLGLGFGDKCSKEFRTSAGSDLIAELTVDMIAVKHEIDVYLAKKHPHQNTFSELLAKNKRLNPKICGATEAATNLQSSTEDMLVVCSVCGKDPTLICSKCDNKPFCDGCSRRWHLHPSRKTHICSVVQILPPGMIGTSREKQATENPPTSSRTSAAASLARHFIGGMLASAFSYVAPYWKGGNEERPLLAEESSTTHDPEVPLCNWVCSFCSFVNSSPAASSVRVCESCYTSSDRQKMNEEVHQTCEYKGPMGTPEECKGNEDKPGDQLLAAASSSSVASGSSVLNGRAKTIVKCSSSYSFDRKEYHSPIVAEYDEIDREKKEAKARFEAQLSSPFPISSTGNLEDSGFRNPESRKYVGKCSRNWPSACQIGLQRQMTEDSQAVVRALRAAETVGYLEEEFECILHLSELSDPLIYMHTEWTQKISAVEDLLAAEDLLCEYWLSTERIRLSLGRCFGNIQEAVRICTNEWREEIDALWSLCYLYETSTALERTASLLDEYSGDFEASRQHIIRELFKDRIWEAADCQDVCQQVGPCLDDEMMRAFQDASVDRERRVRMILVEADLVGWQRAENVLELLSCAAQMDGNISLQDVVEAVKTYGNLRDCSRCYLQIECTLCSGKFPHRMIQPLDCCQCKVCRDCVKTYFEIVIREKHVRDMVCPCCHLPEVDKVDNPNDTDLHFQFLSILLQPLLAADDFDLLQTKWRDWNLMQEPSFLWCAFNECKSGFLADVAIDKVKCPTCQHFMCKNCKKQWEEQHEDLSCEAFLDWKIANDPEQQLLGLARHLEENGIECPRCGSRYSLAKGGCMHFTCGQCRHEFCSGCLQAFKREKTCKQFRRCATLGMHAHHPRDCLYYLKEYPVGKLQQLLQDSNLAYDTEGDGTACSVMIQKLIPEGAKDEQCGDHVTPHSAGLCEMHYKEYLVSLINKNGIDPISIMATNDLVNLMERNDWPAPTANADETAEAYRERVKRLLLERMPLQRRCQTHHIPNSLNG